MTPLNYILTVKTAGNVITSEKQPNASLFRALLKTVKTLSSYLNGQ